MEAPKRTRRIWPLLALVPLMAVLSSPRAPVATTAEEARLAPWRVRFPQVEILKAAEVSARDLRLHVGERGAAEPGVSGFLEARFEREELEERIAGRGERRLIFVAHPDHPEHALRAALQARVWGCEGVYASL